MVAIGIIGSGGRMGTVLLSAIEAAGQVHAGGVDRKESWSADVTALAARSDVLVDFSAPQAVEANLQACIATRKPIVIGTTGLEKPHHDLIDEAAKSIAVLQTGNSSLGIALLTALVRDAAARLGDDWDIEICEMHHRGKLDAPSGTALMLGEAAAEGRGTALESRGATSIAASTSTSGTTGARRRGTIGIASLRGGTVAGDHKVLFAGDGEVITFSHQVENRMVFARGAVRAALWLMEQVCGRYDMNAVLRL